MRRAHLVPPPATASAISDTQATLAGTVNPQGQLTSYAFQYGTTTAYGQQSALTSAGSGTADAPVTADLAGLTAGTTYHYRVIATNATGTTVGADRTLRTTGTAPPPPTAPSATTGGATVNGASADAGRLRHPQRRCDVLLLRVRHDRQLRPADAAAGRRLGLGRRCPCRPRCPASPPARPTTTASSRSARTAPSRSATTETFTTAGAASTRLGLFGQTAFADQNGVGGVFVACLGSGRLQRQPDALAQRQGRSAFAARTRSSRTTAASCTSTLNDLGRQLLRQRGTMNVKAVVANASVRGQTVTKTITLDPLLDEGPEGLGTTSSTSWAY